MSAATATWSHLNLAHHTDRATLATHFREAGVRVPVSAPVARRVENRLAGADANPCLSEISAWERRYLLPQV